MELTPRTLDDDESSDAGPFPSGDGAGGDRPLRPRGSRRRWIALAGIGVVIVALGFVVLKGLGEATVYFRNADEAVAERESLGDRRFRLQGTVVEGAATTDQGVTFDVEFNDVSVNVHHQGDPPEMFDTGQAVVLEGRWDQSGEFFASDRMFVQHDATYESQEDYDERINEAESGGDGAQQRPGSSGDSNDGGS